MLQDPMSPGLDGLRAINKDGSFVYGDKSSAEVVHCSKYKGVDDEGEGGDAARHLVLTKALSLDFDSRFFHGGHDSSAGLGGEDVLPASFTSSLNEDGFQMSSTADAAENNTDLSSRGFRDDTLLAALDAPTSSTDARPPSGLIPETPLADGFSSRLDDQQRLIDALLLRVKEQADGIGELGTSSGLESNDATAAL